MDPPGSRRPGSLAEVGCAAIPIASQLLCCQPVRAPVQPVQPGQALHPCLPTPCELLQDLSLKPLNTVIWVSVWVQLWQQQQQLQ